MKKIFLFSAILAISICCSSLVHAEETHRRSRRNTFWHLFGAPIYFFLELNIHEGSHALSAITTGGRVIEYDPYPHYLYFEDGERLFAFGSTEISWPAGTDDDTIAFNFLAPAVSQLSIFVISDLLISYIPNLNHSFWGPVLYLAGMVCPWIDFIFNLYSGNSSGDFAMAAELLGERRELFYTLGTLIVSIGLWRLIHHFIRIFTERIDSPAINTHQRESRQKRYHKNISF